jgi:hypothetical protein
MLNIVQRNNELPLSKPLGKAIGGHVCFLQRILKIRITWEYNKLVMAFSKEIVYLFCYILAKIIFYSKTMVM